MKSIIKYVERERFDTKYLKILSYVILDVVPSTIIQKYKEEVMISLDKHCDFVDDASMRYKYSPSRECISDTEVIVSSNIYLDQEDDALDCAMDYMFKVGVEPEKIKVSLWIFTLLHEIGHVEHVYSHYGDYEKWVDRYIQFNSTSTGLANLLYLGVDNIRSNERYNSNAVELYADRFAYIHFVYVYKQLVERGLI